MNSLASVQHSQAGGRRRRLREAEYTRLLSSRQCPILNSDTKVEVKPIANVILLPCVY